MNRDTLGFRAKIGVVVPSTNTAVEPELAMMQPVGVTNHVGRMAIANMPLGTPEAFEALVAALVKSQQAAVESVMSCAPDHLVLGLSSETFWTNAAQGKQEIDALRKTAGVGVSTASQAMVECLHEFGLRRIAVLSPYQPVGDERVRSFFETSGIEVTEVYGLRCASPTAAACVSRRDLVAALQALSGSGADAIVQVGTNLPTASFAREAFDWLGQPVLAANTVLYRDALRQLNLLDDAAFCAQWMPMKD